MADYESLSENQVKHLEMIQVVVARLGNNGFLVKSWTITVAGAFLAFAVNQNKWELAVAALAPTILFWLLDSSFLRNERLFRELFDRTRNGHAIPFYMGATAPSEVRRIKCEVSEGEREEDIGSRLRTFRREVLVLFYGAVILTCIVTALIICRSQHG